MQKSVKELFHQHTGKVTDKWSLYLDEWDRLFGPFREKQLNLLEIGIQNGGSLEVWSEVFKQAHRIVGCDIEEKCANLKYGDQRILVIVGDANAPATYQEIQKVSPTYDVIIDDGSHVSSDVIKSFDLYFPILADGGIYVIEDLHTSYWRSFEGGLYYPLSAMAFLKMLADYLNYEHWHTAGVGASPLDKFRQALSVELNDSSLAQIHSIEFLNSMCIITKQPKDANLLGERIVTGTEAIVHDSVVSLNNVPIQKTYEIDHINDGTKRQLFHPG